MAARHESINAPRADASTVSVTAHGVIGRTPELPRGAKVSAEHVTRRVTENETSATNAVLLELTHREGFNTEFGTNVPARGSILEAMESALALGHEASKAAAWSKHLNALAEEAWNLSLANMAKLRPTFIASVQNDPNVALRYPGVASFFRVRDEIAARGVATRKRRKAEKANAPK